MDLGRKTSFTSLFSMGSFRVNKSKSKRKVRLGDDFLQDWENLDKPEIKEHEQLNLLKKYVDKGLVTQEIYEKLARETKEKRLGIFKKREVKEKWIEKPVIQGYLFHRIKVKNKFKWKRFHFTLYRARLVWRKKKDGPKILGHLNLTKDFSLEELETISNKNLPIRQQKSKKEPRKETKHSMRFSFQLSCLGKDYEFAAETEALKKYWFHTIGITLKQIIERSQLKDEPVLMTSRPKVQTLPANVARSMREHNLKQSTLRTVSVKGGQRQGSFVSASVAPRQQRIGTAVSSKQNNEASNYFPRKPDPEDLELDTSISQQGSQNQQVEQQESSPKRSKSVVKKVLLIPKAAVLKNPSLINESRSQLDVPILEVGEEVEVKSTFLEKNKELVRSRSMADVLSQKEEEEEKQIDEEVEEQEDDAPKVVEKKLGLLTRTESFDDNLEMTLKMMKEKLKKQEKKIDTLTTTFEVVTLQKQMLQSEYVEAMETNDDALIAKADENLLRAKEVALVQEELLAAASLKLVRMKEAILKKEQQKAKSRVTKDIVNNVAVNLREVKKTGEEVKKVATDLLKESETKEEELMHKSAQCFEEVKKAREKEVMKMDDMERAMELRRAAVTKSIQLNADTLLELAKTQLQQAQTEREKKEEEWRQVTEDSIAVRMKTFELKKAVKEKPTPTREERGKSTARAVQSTTALADFIAENAVPEKKEKKVDKKKSKLADFLRSEQALPSPKASPLNNQDDDYSESFYSDEHIEERENEEYFENKTRNVSMHQKSSLNELFLAQEIDRLCEVIEKIGQEDSKGNTFVTFEELRNEYKTISDRLNGILFKAKSANRIKYSGDFLLKGEDDETKIYLVFKK